MIFPVGRKRNLREKIKDAFKTLPARLRNRVKKLPSVKLCLFKIHFKLKKVARSARYLLEDAWFETKKLVKHTEALLFSLIMVLALIMVLNAGNANFLNSLIALLLIVLIVVIYMQLKLQKRMLDQYVPRIDFIRIRRCQVYSDRIRTVNLFGAIQKLDKIRKVRNVKIRYEIINDSFSPVSIQAASLVIKLKKSKRMSLPSTMSVLNVEPKRTASNEVTFKLAREVDFDSIDWVELSLAGNCKKKARISPRLYVNVLLRGKKPELIFEPFERFRKRSEQCTS